MTIKDLLMYMEEKKTCTLSMIAIHFHTQESAVEPILVRLIEKGKIVRKVSAPNNGCCGCSCGNGCGCGDSSNSCGDLIEYRWVG